MTAARLSPEDKGRPWAVLCANGQGHRDYGVGEASRAVTEEAARGAVEFMDESREDSPWDCGPHTVGLEPAAVEALAVRTLAAIPDANDPHTTNDEAEHHAADRERVASDLAGLRLLHEAGGDVHPEARRCLSDLFTAGLCRTADLYGVTA